MFVEGSGEVALEEFVVINGLRYHSAHKLKVTQMI